MKSYSAAGLALFVLCALVACTAQKQEVDQEPQTAVSTADPQGTSASLPTQQEVQVKNPQSGSGRMPNNSPGGSSAARIISPVTP